MSQQTTIHLSSSSSHLTRNSKSVRRLSDSGATIMSEPSRKRARESSDHSGDITSSTDSIFDVNKVNLEELMTKLEKPFRQTACGKWLESYLVGKREQMKDFLTDICQRSHNRMKDFCDQLLYMIKCDEEDLTDGMFQELFTLFVRIFDLKIRGYTNFQRSSPMVTVGNRNIESIPDALIYQTAKRHASDEKIFAVVQVKKEYSNSEGKVSERRLRHAENRATFVDHLNSSLKGQHVGGMLAVLPKSVFELHGIYGMIVQGTEVTMASMSVGEQYYKNLKEGTLNRMTPVVKYSRPFNFLKESDRESLIHTLVDMKALLDTLR
uniref:Uncharacterized protein LOC111115199 isoform X2 n=1 Tax=Crassostrea virginica TaxID=6565 RepID=A0A8B8C1N2_CRAVI|nr:uncharacterized protein LOC111115199 isoform X2 [Crassostrea virginica]